MLNSPLIVSDIDHAITGRDVVEFMQNFKLSLGVTAELFSITRTKLDEIIQSEEPIEKISIALLVRLYSAHPHLLKALSMPEFYEKIGGESVLKKRHFPIIFGVDGSASYRWLDWGKPSGRIVMDLAELTFKLPNSVDDLIAFACREADMRGVRPFKTGCWSIKYEMKEGESQRGDINGPTNKARERPSKTASDALRQKIEAKRARAKLGNSILV